MFSEKTAGDTFFLESSRSLRSLRLETSLSRPDPEANAQPVTRMNTQCIFILIIFKKDEHFLFIDDKNKNHNILPGVWSCVTLREYRVAADPEP